MARSGIPSTRREPSFGKATTQEAQPSRHAPIRLAFTGDPGQYFGIWLSNIVLTILTLGIYSAWAAVRTRRFFCGNTSLDGHAFDYTAKPTTILKGRAIAFAAITVIAIVNQLFPDLQGFAVLPLLFILPWLICRSMRFRARVSEWRTVRFHWRGTYGGVFVIYLFWPFVGILSLGLALPFASRAIRAYMADNLDFGRTRFSTNLSVGPFYRILLVSLLGSLAIIVISIVVLFAITKIILSFQAIQIGGRPLSVEAVVPLALLVPLFTIPMFYTAACRAAMINGMTLEGGHRLSSEISLTDLLGMVFVNILLIVVTLGFAYPWAKVRLWRIQAEAIVVHPGGPLDSFVDSEAVRGDVFSSEFVEMEGFEFGL